MIDSLYGFYDSSCFRDNVLTLPDASITVTETGEGDFLIEGASEWEELPRRFIFESEAMVPAVLVPFLLQCVDGEPRV